MQMENGTKINVCDIGGLNIIELAPFEKLRSGENLLLIFQHNFPDEACLIATTTPNLF